MKGVTLEPGKYIICDPCYIVDDDKWMDLLNDCNFFEISTGHFTRGDKEIEVVAFNTAYGDGTYEDHEGNEYPVDAGLIGIMKFDDFKDVNLKWDHIDTPFARVVEFENEFYCYYDSGTIVFGDVVINTDPFQMEDEGLVDEEGDEELYKENSEG